MTDKIVTSEKGMSPSELKLFAEQLAQEKAKGLADLTPTRLDKMIDQIHEEDKDLSNYLYVKLAVLKLLRNKTIEKAPLAAQIPIELDRCHEVLLDAHLVACKAALQDVLTYTDRYLKKALGRDVDHRAVSPIFEQQLADLANKELKYPEKLPFPATYLSFGEGFHSYDDSQVADTLMGFLVSEKIAWQFFIGRKHPALLPVCFYHEGHWTNFCSKAPWCMVQLIDLINSYRTFVEEVPRGLKMKMAYEKMGKRLGLKHCVPPPYYHVKLHEVHLKEKAESLLPSGRLLGHRHDRRGHERCKFRRGKLPMDEKLEAKLVERGYEVFKQNPVDVHAIRRLSIRGMPYKAADEWLAIKTTWVKDTVVGNESLPYVPSIHVVPSKGDQP